MDLLGEYKSEEGTNVSLHDSLVGKQPLTSQQKYKKQRDEKAGLERQVAEIWLREGNIDDLGDYRIEAKRRWEATVMAPSIGAAVSGALCGGTLLRSQAEDSPQRPRRHWEEFPRYRHLLEEEVGLLMGQRLETTGERLRRIWFPSVTSDSAGGMTRAGAFEPDESQPPSLSGQDHIERDQNKPSVNQFRPHRRATGFERSDRRYAHDSDVFGLDPVSITTEASTYATDKQCAVALDLEGERPEPNLLPSAATSESKPSKTERKKLAQRRFRAKQNGQQLMRAAQEAEARAQAVADPSSLGSAEPSLMPSAATSESKPSKTERKKFAQRRFRSKQNGQQLMRAAQEAEARAQAVADLSSIGSVEPSLMPSAATSENKPLKIERNNLLRRQLRRQHKALQPKRGNMEPSAASQVLLNPESAGRPTSIHPSRI